MKWIRWAGLIVLSAMVLLVGTLEAASAADRLYVITQGGRTGLKGFIDARGQVIIAPQFAQARPFREGLAAVQAADSQLYGYIDRSGGYVIPPQFKTAMDFQEGLAATDKGYVDRTGKLVIAGMGDSFYQGLGRLHRQPGAFIDKTGAVVLDTPYEKIWQTQYSEFIAFVKNGKMGFMDWNQKVIIPAVYGQDRYYQDELFKEAITPVRLARPGERSSWGFINRSGETVVEFSYDWAEPFRDGRALVGQDKVYGFINTAGEVAIPLCFEGAESFSEGLAAVQVNGLWGFIDVKGRMVVKPQYLGLRWGVPMRFTEGLAVVRTAAGTGVIDRTGELVIPPVYHSIDEFSGGVAAVRWPNGMSGYVDREGRIIWINKD